MRSFKLTLAYDGTAYAGWQVQPGQPSLQETLEQAIHELTSEKIRAVASGRTDSGVHALGQVVSFASTTELPIETIARAINVKLPEDMTVLSVEEAPVGFDAIRHAVKKRYRYVIQNAPLLDPFTRRYSWYIKHRLDDQAMAAAAKHLLGRHDFTTFKAAKASTITSERTIFEASIERITTETSQQIRFEIEADGFLYNMVRIIVGALVEVGRGYREPDWMQEIIEAKDRQAAGPTAPPQGLFLVSVDYDDVDYGD